MKVLVFTGAGVSRESGLATFRDSDGLWAGHSIADVCSVEAWEDKPQTVLDFYNERRREVRKAQPNAAHHAIAQLEDDGFDVKVVTQNIDDLHERAGSSQVIHVHGEIVRMRADDDFGVVDCPGDIQLGDVDARGRQYRPHVVFFGEGVWNMLVAMRAQAEADILLVVGSTLAVYSAASIADECQAAAVWVVDLQFPNNSRLMRRCRGATLRSYRRPPQRASPRPSRQSGRMPGGEQFGRWRNFARGRRFAPGPLALTMGSSSSAVAARQATGHYGQLSRSINQPIPIVF